MGKHSTQITALFLTLLSMISLEVTAQNDFLDLLNNAYSGSHNTLKESGYPELSAIQISLEARDIAKARNQIQAILNRDTKSFLTERHETFIKGWAFYLQAQIISNEDNDDKMAENILKKACELGNQNAPFAMATHLKNSNRNLNEIKNYLTMGAELGNVKCIDLLIKHLDSKKFETERYYWILIREMMKDSSSINFFKNITYEKYYNNTDRVQFKMAMEKFSDAGGEVISTIDSLPGRSIFTSAFVEIALHSMLKNYLHITFGSDSGIKNISIKKSFNDIENLLRSRINFYRPFLLINKNYATNERHFLFDNQNLINVLLPGDAIITSCGVLTHHTVVWSVDRKNNKILLIDPFYEFWQPSHNICITQFTKLSYKYSRSLIELNVDEVKKITVAVITMRDSY